MRPNIFVGRVEGSAIYQKWYFEVTVDHLEQTTHMTPHLRIGWANAKGWVCGVSSVGSILQTLVFILTKKKIQFTKYLFFFFLWNRSDMKSHISYSVYIQFVICYHHSNYINI